MKATIVRLHQGQSDAVLGGDPCLQGPQHRLRDHIREPGEDEGLHRTDTFGVGPVHADALLLAKTEINAPHYRNWACPSQGEAGERPGGCPDARAPAGDGRELCQQTLDRRRMTHRRRGLRPGAAGVRSAERGCRACPGGPGAASRPRRRRSGWEAHLRMGVSFRKGPHPEGTARAILRHSTRSSAQVAFARLTMVRISSACAVSSSAAPADSSELAAFCRAT